jgi:hypothetical protein
MTTTEIPVDNGVNVEALLGVRDALPGSPEIAQFQWRSTVSWVNGTHSRSDVETFYGFGGEQQHHTTFSYDVDHPLQFAAQDNGITPVIAAWSARVIVTVSVVPSRPAYLRRVSTSLVSHEFDREGSAYRSLRSPSVVSFAPVRARSATVGGPLGLQTPTPTDA